MIRRTDGSVCELCTYIARTRQEQEQGLMAVTDLGGYDGMMFAFDQSRPEPFWMKDTVMALSAAWFAPDGAFVASVDMAPCAPSVPVCPNYGPPDPALHVLEVPQGALSRLQIGPGARLESVSAPCHRQPT